jgi:elongation factor P
MTNADTSDFRNGMCLNLDGKLVQIIEFQHVKPGKGAAFVRTKLRNMENGRVLDKTFNAGVKVTEVRLERRKYQYLYNDAMGYHVMNTETYEQAAIPESKINAPQFLKEGMEVEILVNADSEEYLACELPPFIEVEITYAEPGVKGNTATNATKLANVETGAEIRVPLFISEGDIVKVDTRTGDYSERIKTA